MQVREIHENVARLAAPCRLLLLILTVQVRFDRRVQASVQSWHRNQIS